MSQDTLVPESVRGSGTVSHARLLPEYSRFRNPGSRISFRGFCDLNPTAFPRKEGMKDEG